MNSHIKPNPICIFSIMLIVFFFCGSVYAGSGDGISANGLGTIVSSGPDYLITGGTLAGGKNLFHSFNDFNIETNESVTFTGNTTISNIISRITGSNDSWIDGGLTSDIAGANLFLINPNGMVFGPNAWVDIGGSLHASTADYIKIEDANFYADPSKDSSNALLKVSDPTAFGFLDGSTSYDSTIEVQSWWIEMASGETISFVGGDVNIDGSYYAEGYLFAPEGRINIASVASPGELSINEMDVSSFDALGDIAITGYMWLSVSPGGWGSDVGAAGDIYIRGGNLYVADSGLYAATGDLDGGIIDIKVDDLVFDSFSWIGLSADYEGNSADLNIEAAHSINISGMSAIFANAYGFDGPDPAGNAGTISLRAPDILIEDFSGLSSTSWGDGNASEIRIHTDNLEITSDSALAATAEGNGDGGRVYIDAAKNVTLADGAIIHTKSTGEFGHGNGGDIVINTPIFTGSSCVLTVDAQGNGEGGNMTLTGPAGSPAESILFTDQSRIFAGSIQQTANAGDAGRITMKADTISFQNGVQLGSETFGPGSGGNVFLQAEDIDITGGSYISVETMGSGNGGSLTISGVNGGDSANRLSVIGTDADGASLDPNNTRIFAATSAGGDAGAISIRADTICFNKGAYISSESKYGDSGYGNTDSGKAGSISVNASDFTLQDNSYYTVKTGTSGIAGNIDIQTDRFTLEDNAAISSASIKTGGAAGDAGKVDITVNGQMEMSGSSRITTSTYGLGNAGGIRIDGDGLIMDGKTSIASSSNSTGESGKSGTIDICVENTAQMAGESKITTETAGSGDAGDIRMQLAELKLSDNAAISSASVGSIANAGDGGKVNLVAGSGLEMEGSSRITTSTYGLGKAGGIGITTDGLIMGQNASISSSSNGTGDSGNSGTIDIDVNRTMTIGGTSTITTETAGTGSAGDVSMDTAQLNLSGSSSISSAANGTEANAGDAGKVDIDAKETIRMSGSSRITTSTYGAGNAGAIGIMADDVTMDQDGTISSSSNGTGDSGNSGTIDMNVNHDLKMRGASIITTGTAGSGNAGDVRLKTDTLQLLDSASIESTATGTGENAGSAGSADININSGIGMGGSSRITTSTYGLGNAGAIGITAAGLTMDQSASIASSSNHQGEGGTSGTVDVNVIDAIIMKDQSKITSGTAGSGNAGDVSLDAKILKLSGNASISSASNGIGTGTGDAGKVEIAVSGDMAMNTLAQVTTATYGTGDAGAIGITADNLTMDQHVSITSSSNGEGESGNSGTIGINVKDTVKMNGGSNITTETTGSGNAGDVSMEMDTLELLWNATISSATKGIEENAGTAGKVAITAGNELAMSGSSQITTSTYGLGHAGEISIASDSLTMDRKASIHSSSNKSGNSGNSGTIGIDVNDWVTMDSDSQITTETWGSGHAGDLHIAALQLQLSGKAAISSAANGTGDNAGDAGKVDITVGNGMTMDESSRITTATSGLGHAGKIDVTVNSIMMDLNAAITSSSNGKGNSGDSGVIQLIVNHSVEMSGDSKITTETMGTGTAGDIHMNMTQLRLSESGSISSAALGTEANAGNAGKVNIVVSDDMTMEGLSQINTSTYGLGNAGEIGITISDLTMDQDVSISSSSNGTGTSGNSGTINILANNAVEMTGEGQITTETAGSGNAGDVTMTVAGLQLSESASISSAARGTGANAGDAGKVSINGSGEIGLEGWSRITTATDGLGNAGEIGLKADGLFMAQEAAIVSSSNGTDAGGNSGTIDINVNNSIEMKAQGKITTETAGAGDAGDISMDGAQLNMSDSSSISSAANGTGENAGDAGKVAIYVEDGMTMSGLSRITTSTYGLGNAGAIGIVADDVTMDQDASVSSSSNGTGDSGNSGIIDMNVNHAVKMADAGTITTGTAGSGAAGDVIVKTNTLQLSDSALIQSTATGTGENAGSAGRADIVANGDIQLSGSSRITTSTYGMGDAGAIGLTTDDLTLDQNAAIASSSNKEGDSGNSGTIGINVNHTLEMRGQSQITTESEGSGDAGDIDIKTSILRLYDHASISSASRSPDAGGAAGTISIRSDDAIRLFGSTITTEAVNTAYRENIDGTCNGKISINTVNLLRLENSEITTSVRGGDGNGGDIDIDPELIILKNSNIIANAYEGNGGNIHIVADNFVQSADSVIEASSALGMSGTIRVDAPDFDVSSLAFPAVAFLDATRWVATPCSVRFGENISSFVVSGKVGTPTVFDDLMASPPSWLTPEISGDRPGPLSPVPDNRFIPDLIWCYGFDRCDDEKNCGNKNLHSPGILH